MEGRHLAFLLRFYHNSLCSNYKPSPPRPQFSAYMNLRGLEGAPLRKSVETLWWKTSQVMCFAPCVWVVPLSILPFLFNLNINVRKFDIPCILWVFHIFISAMDLPLLATSASLSSSNSCFPSLTGKIGFHGAVESRCGGIIVRYISFWAIAKAAAVCETVCLRGSDMLHNFTCLNKIDAKDTVNEDEYHCNYVKI